MTTSQQSRLPRWALWIAGAVTLLALAILVISIVLGVRAGQEQYAIRSRQQVGMALQQAIDLQQEGQVQAALDAYANVLLLDPDNETANQAVQALQSGMPIAAAPTAAGDQQTGPQAASPTAAPATDAGGGLLRPNTVLSNDTSTQPLATSSTGGLTPVAPGVTGTPTDLWASAQAAFRAGRWQEAVGYLTTLRTTPGTADPLQVENLLFEAYVNLAAEKDNEENLEGALGWYDRALQLRPAEASIRQERDLVDRYLDVLGYFDVDWARSVELLTQLYALDPQYRDVEERLHEALLEYAADLNAAGDACAAQTQLETAATHATDARLTQLIADTTTACVTGVPMAGVTPDATRVATTGASTTAAEIPAPTGGTGSGRILYSSVDIVNGRNTIFSQPVDGSNATVLVEEGAQPNLRADGVRIAYRNWRSDQGGISAYDPATGVFFRITDYPEDVIPSWDPSGGRVVFASNREGDRRWRIYTAWGEENGAVVTLSFGESPAWSPTSDQIVHRGCDDSGNNCGLWLMDSAGGNRRALTTVAGDNRPAWSPDGRSIVFMSDRDGGQDIYRVDVSTGQVTRLSENPSLDALPTVSPDGLWVAYLSNREGGWKIWAVPLAGGQTRLIAAIKGDVGDWNGQGLQWVN